MLVGKSGITQDNTIPVNRNAFNTQLALQFGIKNTGETEQKFYYPPNKTT